MTQPADSARLAGQGITILSQAPGLPPPRPLGVGRDFDSDRDFASQPGHAARLGVNVVDRGGHGPVNSRICGPFALGGGPA